MSAAGGAVEEEAAALAWSDLRREEGVGEDVVAWECKRECEERAAWR